MWPLRMLLRQNCVTFAESLFQISHQRAFSGLVVCASGINGRQMLQPSSMGTSMQIEQIRWRKRGCGKPLTKQQRLERRIAREAKEAKRHEFTFIQKMKMKRVVKSTSISLQGHGRYDAEKETEPVNSKLGASIRMDYKTHFLPVPEALHVYRRMLGQEMGDLPSTPVKLRIELNMTTEKAAKMVQGSEEIVPIPFPFHHHNEKRAIFALTADKARREEAVEAGAEVAFGVDMVKKILKGSFSVDDFDFCVAHTDIGPSIASLRGILKSKCPTKQNGGLTDDLPTTIKRFLAGTRLVIKSDAVYPEWGLTEVMVGLISMSDDELDANIACVLNALFEHRSPALGPFINRAIMTVPDKKFSLHDQMFLALDVSKYEPVVAAADIAKLDAKKNRRKKIKEAKNAKEKEEEIEEVLDYKVEGEEDYLLKLM